MESTVYNADDIRKEIAKKNAVIYRDRVSNEIKAIDEAARRMFQEGTTCTIIPGMFFQVWSDKAYAYAEKHGFYLYKNMEKGVCELRMLPKEE